MNLPLPHSSVLLAEVLHAFSPLSLTVMVDGTLGAGGHAEALLEHHPEIQHYVGIDSDPYALEFAQKRLKAWEHKMHFKQGNFADFPSFLKEAHLPSPNGILLDLGVSSMQLDEPSRGFSFRYDAPLDMRMNPSQGETAADIVNTYSEKELGVLFREYGEEKKWRAAAHAIVKAREHKEIRTTFDLKEILIPPLAPAYRKQSIHPCTLVFQALRICVNQELEALRSTLPQAIEALAPGGRLAVISFHRLEDRLVKKEMRLAASDKWETAGLGGSGLFLDKEPSIKLITRKPIEPSEEEIKRNPRSRSAKLRVAEKISPPL